ncbi:hypothetical protein FGO68_gene7592 [Halteria grandinella]|uniref:Uncharacterized protein n=1 Tax=Halteria grandinella TaxID=5974 RepID=A0A8J8P2T3_HALGN|nr:hypothetical protein FGO68_gene7592 [Halteria grandinella]
MMESNLSSIKGELQISQLKSAAQAAQSLNTTMRQGYITLGSGSSELQQLSQPRANAPSSSAERRRIHSARETKQGGKSNDMGDHPKQESNRGIDAYQRNYLERQRVLSERGSNDQITSFATDLQEPRILKSPLSNSGQENVAQAFIMSDDKIANKLHQMRTDYDKIKNEIQQTLVQAHTLTSEERRNSR